MEFNIGKLHILIEVGGIVTKQMATLLRNGDYAAAIRLYRQKNGYASLIEAKHRIDEYAERHKIEKIFKTSEW